MADQPPNDVSFQGIIDTVKSLWQALVLPTGLAFVGVYKWLADRKDKQTAEADKIQMNLAAINVSDRKQISDDNNALLDRQDKKIAAAEQEIKQLRAYWWEALHAANSARQRVNALEERMNIPVSIWTQWTWETGKKDG